MMKQKDYCRQLAFTVMYVFATVILHAQYSITAMLPSGSIYMRSQLWFLSVSNTSSITQEAKLEVEMKDIQTHQTVLSAVSGVFTLLPGVRAVQERAIEPVQYNGAANVVNQSAAAFLPVGQYQVCYQLFVIRHSFPVLVADDCEQIAIEPLSPPVLTSPENDSVVQTVNPSFMWLPPAPVTMFSNLNYDFMVSEVYKGQSINDAIQKNLPLQQALSLQQPFFTYSLQGPQLEKGKKYVWQIIARDQQKLAARSEVWSFTMGDKKDVVLGNNTVYLLLEGNAGGIASVGAGMLHIKYVSATPAHKAPLVFKDGNGTLLNTVNMNIKQGDNYLDIPLSGRFQSNHSYVVTISEVNGRTSSLAFTIK